MRFQLYSEGLSDFGSTTACVLSSGDVTHTRVMIGSWVGGREKSLS